MIEQKDMVDGDRVLFNEYRKHLPTLAADFPPAKIVRDKIVVIDHRYKWSGVCQMCGFPLRHAQGDVHHIIGGAGRSDEPTNLLRLCSVCHDESWSVILPECLWFKWATDPRNLSWVRLAVLYGRFLPDPKQKRGTER